MSRMWLVTQIHVITKKSSTYTQGDYSVVSYDINIYNQEFHLFEKKIAYVSIFYKISSCEQKKNVICHANTDYDWKKLDIHSRGL